jgi:hypothetical protein
MHLTLAEIYPAISAAAVRVAHDPDERSERAGKAEDADSLCRMPPTPPEGRRMLVHATVRMPAPKTASSRPMLIGYDGSRRPSSRSTQPPRF